MEKRSSGLGVKSLDSKKSELLSSTARLDFLEVAGMRVGVKNASVINIEIEFAMDLRATYKNLHQEYIH